MSNDARARRSIFAHNLRELRSRAKLSQSDLGDMVGVSNRIVSNWERELSMPKGDTLEKIAIALGVQMSDLFSDSLAYPDGSVPSRSYDNYYVLLTKEELDWVTKMKYLPKELSYVALNKEQRALVERYAALDNAKQKALLELLDVHP